MWKKAKNKIINQMRQPLRFAKLTKLNFVALLTSAILFLMTFILRNNALTLVCVVLSCFVALFLLIELLMKNRLNIYFIISYGILIFGTVLIYLIWGADPFWKRLGYNFLTAGLSMIFTVLLYFIPKLRKDKVIFYLTRATAFCMIGASLLYFLTMSIRIKPTAKSLQLGHDQYLKNIEKSIKDNAPNVLVILMDDMAFSDISSYSYLGQEGATIKTPNIDSIGTDGIMMENCYSSSPVSSPSRFGILTGRYSARGHLDNVIFPTKQQFSPYGETRHFNAFQFTNNVDGILGDEITVAEAMQAKGYNTALFGKWNLGDYGEYLPTNQGFDYFFGSHYVNDMNPYNVVREQNGVPVEVYTHKEMKDQSLSTERFTKELNTYIDKSIDNNEKFFAEYWSPWPHYPIFSNASGNGEGDTSDDSYIDCIEEFDTYLGTVFDNLKERGVYDDTLVIFTSDNGPGREGVTGALRGRKNTPFEGGHKVPFLACYPNSDLAKNVPLDDNGHKMIASRCMNMDVFNTILDYADIDIPTDRVIDGKSMRPLWEGIMASDAPLHDSLFYLKSGRILGVNMPIETNIVEKEVDSNNVAQYVTNHGIYDFKYYRDVHTENSAFIDQKYKDYLFNLDTDPAEGYNLSMRYPDIAKTLKAEITRFEKELKTNRRGIKK